MVNYGFAYNISNSWVKCFRKDINITYFVIWNKVCNSKCSSKLISSVICLARPSRAPLKIPGNTFLRCCRTGRFPCGFVCGKYWLQPVISSAVQTGISFSNGKRSGERHKASGYGEAFTSRVQKHMNKKAAPDELLKDHVEGGCSPKWRFSDRTGRNF